jgi:hypothetical protein
MRNTGVSSTKKSLLMKLVAEFPTGGSEIPTETFKASIVTEWVKSSARATTSQNQPWPNRSFDSAPIYAGSSVHRAASLEGR